VTLRVRGEGPPRAANCAPSGGSERCFFASAGAHSRGPDDDPVPIGEPDDDDFVDDDDDDEEEDDDGDYEEE
jgi:hypothetical protein